MKQRIIATANSVVTRFEAPPVKRRPELVVGKYYRKGKPLSASINATLRKLDPEGKHFAFYVFTSTKRVADAPTTQQIQRALKGEVGPRMTLSPHYNKLRSPTALTRQQYRHLAKSLRLLNDNDIIHGDLVDNVMLDAKTNLPVIIDFDEARVNSDKVLKAFQLGVLGREFKVAPKRQLKFVDS